METVLPLRLTGGAFTVYQQMTEDDKRDSSKIKLALRTAFAVDSFTAYELFVSRRLHPGETVDVFLAELRRLAVHSEDCQTRRLSVPLWPVCWIADG